MSVIARCQGWIESLDFYASTPDGSPEMVVAVAVEMRAELQGLLDQHAGAVTAIERVAWFAKALRTTGDDPTPAEIADDILTLLYARGQS